jgi:hypothetical protein
MFFKLKLSHDLALHPKYLGRNLRKTIEKKLFQVYYYHTFALLRKLLKFKIAPPRKLKEK